MCEDYNLNLDELLEGERKKKKSKKILLISLISLILLLIGLALYYATIPREFEFKTLNASCKDFTLSGRLPITKVKLLFTYQILITVGKILRKIYEYFL